jgi:methyl-accepting chemotaxis protein
MRFFRRRKFIVNRELQISLLRNSFLYVLLFVAAIGVVFFVPLLAELTESESASERTLQVGNQIRYLYTYFWPAVILAMILIFLHSVRASHKVAGPLYRFKLVLEALKEGEISSPISIRKGDYLQQEADLINQVLESLRQNLEGLQQSEVQLNQALSEYRRELGQNLSTEEEERVRDLTEKATLLADRLRYFNLAA